MTRLFQIFVTLLSAFAIVTAFYIPALSDPDLPDIIKTCGDESDILTIYSLHLDPNPPQKGQTFNIEFHGFLNEQVELGAYIKVIVKYGVVKLLQKTFDLCEQAPQINKECPIEAGLFEFTKDVELPKEIPPGKYSINALIKTVDDRQITCLNGVIVFKP